MEHFGTASTGLGTVEKALDILQHLHEAGGPRGVSEIGRALDLPKSTAHRLLAALGRRGMVERSAQGRYRPGIALVALGVGILEREPVVIAARPVLEELAESLGETIFLAGARGGRLFVVDKQEGRGFLRAAPRVGAEVPAHATAIGKIYLALDAGEVSAASRGLERFTRATLSSRTLPEELERVRHDGLAENHGEWIEGLSGIAAPIFVRQRLAGAIAVSGPSARFDTEGRRRFRQAIADAGRRVAARLSGIEGEDA